MSFLWLGVKLGNFTPRSAQHGQFLVHTRISGERNNPEVAKPNKMFRDSKCERLSSPPTHFVVEIQIKSSAREAKRSMSAPAVVSQVMATLQTPGDSQGSQRSTEMLMALSGNQICLRASRG